MEDVLTMIAIFAGYIGLQYWLLPKLGVPT
jgi:hypothetical protein